MLHFHPRLRLRAFTLLEMLMVIAIIAIVAAFTIPSTVGMLKGSRMSEGGQLITEQLALARQIAVSKNHSVEVRFYRYGDSEVPGENSNNPDSGKFRALQSFEIAESGTLPIGAMQRLPTSIVIDTSTTYSPLLNGASDSTSPVAANGGTLGYQLPRGVKTSYKSVAFRFLPDGSTDLPRLSNTLEGTSKWFLTLHDVNDVPKAEQPPKDYYTIQINPLNGDIHTYRPQ